MAKRRITAIGGDGVGPELVDAACYVLESADFDLEITKPPAGESALEQYGEAFPEETKRLCDTADAVLFGAATKASINILIYIRWVKDNYLNIRPAKYYTGAQSSLKDPSGIDLVVLRENSEDLYLREGELSVLRERYPDFRDFLNKSIADYGEGMFALRIVSEQGTQRFAQSVCEYALQRKKKGYPGKVTCVHKNNAMPKSDSLWERIIREEVEKHPELTYEQYYVDDMARRLVRYPSEFDMLATTNMFGDILSDEAAELVGGLGIVGSGCIGGKVPYFESVAGSAPKYAGKNIINPSCTILAAKLMLEHLGMQQEAEAVEKAVATVYKEGKSLTFDQGGNASTKEFAEAVLRKIK